MKKNSGQALIEFIIVLPVLVLIIAAIIDTFNLMYNTYELENDLNTIITFYQNDEEDEIEKYTTQNKLSIAYENNINTTTITINKKIRIATPIMKNILGNPHTITTSRVIYDEEK